MSYSFPCLWTLVTAAFLVAHAAPVWAQVTRPEELRPQTGLPQDAEPPAPIGPGDPEPEPEPAPDATLFELGGVRFEGNTALDDAELASVADEFVGSTVTLGDLREVADRAEQRYRDADLVATRVIIPPQQVRGGVVTFRVVEGFVGRVIIRGDAGVAQGQLERYLAKLRGEVPLTLATVERYLLLARDLPGLSVRGTLRPAPASEGPGAIDVIVDVARQPLSGYANVENGRSEATGPWVGSVFGRWNSFGPQAQTLDVLGLVSFDIEELQVGRIAYRQQIGSEGTTGAATVTYGQSDPSQAFSIFDVETTSFVAAAGVEHPFVRTRELSVFGRGDFELVNQDQDQFGVRATEDRLRVLALGGTVLAQDPFGFNELDLELRQGLNIFNASEEGVDQEPALSRPNANPQAFVARGRYVRQQPIVNRLGLRVEVRGQFATDPLVAYEEFSLGNLTIGRGYTPGAVFGDRGIAASGELQYRPPVPRNDYVDRVQLFGFYDFGQAWNLESGPLFPETESLSSAGLGVRFRLVERVFGEATYAHAFDERLSTTTETFGDEFLFRLTATF